MVTRHTQHNIRFQGFIAAAGVLLFVIKILAWQLTRSDAVFSDAMESIVNILAAFMGLYSLALAAKPRDSEHPYGHGKVEFITSGVEGVLIMVAGVIIIVQSIVSLLQENVPHQLEWGMLLIGGTAVINYMLGHLSWKRGVRQNSLVLQSSGKHLKTDTLTTLALVLGLLLVHVTGWNWADAVLATGFAVYIIYSGYRILRRALSGIMDEADETLLEDLAVMLEEHRKPQWIDLHNVRIQQHGSRLHIDAHMTLPWYYELRRAHQELEEVYQLIGANASRPVELNFHIDDCRKISCSICTMQNCPVRQLSLKKKIPWTSETLSQHRKHGL